MKCQYYNECENKTLIEYELFCNHHFKLCPEYRCFKNIEKDAQDLCERLRRAEGLNDLMEMELRT